MRAFKSAFIVFLRSAGITLHVTTTNSYSKLTHGNVNAVARSLYSGPCNSYNRLTSKHDCDLIPPRGFAADCGPAASVTSSKRNSVGKIFSLISTQSDRDWISDQGNNRTIQCRRRDDGAALAWRAERRLGRIGNSDRSTPALGPTDHNPFDGLVFFVKSVVSDAVVITLSVAEFSAVIASSTRSTNKWNALLSSRFAYRPTRDMKTNRS